MKTPLLLFAFLFSFCLLFSAANPVPQTKHVPFQATSLGKAPLAGTSPLDSKMREIEKIARQLALNQSFWPFSVVARQSMTSLLKFSLVNGPVFAKDLALSKDEVLSNTDKSKLVSVLGSVEKRLDILLNLLTEESEQSRIKWLKVAEVLAQTEDLVKSGHFVLSRAEVKPKQPLLRSLKGDQIPLSSTRFDSKLQLLLGAIMDMQAEVDAILKFKKLTFRQKGEALEQSLQSLVQSLWHLKKTVPHLRVPSSQDYVRIKKHIRNIQKTIEKAHNHLSCSYNLDIFHFTKVKRGGTPHSATDSILHFIKTDIPAVNTDLDSILGLLGTKIPVTGSSRSTSRSTTASSI